MKDDIFLGAKKAHLHAPVVRDVCVELPPAERAQLGYCCRLKRCLYGARAAPQQWERFAAAPLDLMGFQRGRASDVRFHHPSRGIMGLVHGADFVFCGADAHLDWVVTELAKVISLKAMGELGGDREKGTFRR